MKNIISLLLALIISVNYLNAQYVTIPDSNFVSFLNNNYPNCMNGNQMDTTCINLNSDTLVQISNKNISDLEGIQYFDNLIHLYANYNNIEAVGDLPLGLRTLSLSVNPIRSVGALPSGLEELHFSYCTIPSINLPPSLKKLNLIGDSLVYIDSFPVGLTFLSLDRQSLLDSIPTLPSSIEFLKISNTGLNPHDLNLSSLNNLTDLYLNNLGLSYIPNLPTHRYNLDISNNLISDWSNMPSNLGYLNIRNCHVDSLNKLPFLAPSLICGDTSLTSVEGIADSMHRLEIWNSSIHTLKSPKKLLNLLLISNENIISIDSFPKNLQWLELVGTDILSLPTLPNFNLSYLRIDWAPSLKCLPTLPNTLTSPHRLRLTNLNITCLPNYVPAMNNNTIQLGPNSWNSVMYYKVPLCTNDPFTNPNACDAVKGVEGYVFEDDNSNCNYDSTENSIKNVPMKLYDGSQNLMEVSATASNGRYFLNSDIGNYSIAIDTVNKPYAVNCKLDTSLNIVAPDTFVQNIDFGIECKAGYDVGTKSIVTSGFVFPGQEHSLQIKAGDLSNFYGLSCASSVSGSVTVNITGPVQYSGIQTNALVPTVNGLSFTYSIADFGNIDMENDFGLLFTVDTTAQSGDQICVNVITDPVSQDNVTSNNNYTHCYEVVNSYDPNNKLVYPSSVEPGFNDWLTYTINFQNTGSAPAFNIRLEDTLSAMFDLSSFEVIGFSHTNNYSLDGNKLKIYYPNIMLSDSTTDLEGSKGYFQFRIKPLNPMTAGVDMENEAFIYFDYNAPIQTNMATTSCLVLTSNESIDDLDIKAFPNPLSDILYITGTKQGDVLELYTINGQRVPINVINKGEVLSINVSNISKGIYQLMVKSNTNCKTVKLIK